MSHLSDLVQVLIVTFGEQCPVYAIPPGHVQKPCPQQNLEQPSPLQFPSSSKSMISSGYPFSSGPHSPTYPSNLRPSYSPSQDGRHPNLLMHIYKLKSTVNLDYACAHISDT